MPAMNPLRSEGPRARAAVRRWARAAALVALAGALLATTACAKKAGEDSLEVVFSTGDHDHLSAVRFLPDGKRLATASGIGVVRVWDLATARQTHTFVNGNVAHSLGVGPDGRVLLVGSEDGSLALWDLPTSSLVKKWTAHAKAVHGAEISPDGTIAASGSDDGTIGIWELPSGRRVRTLTGHASWVGRVKFSPDGRRLLSAGADATLRIWDVATGAALQTLSGHSTWVRSGVFLADGARVLSGGYDLELREWDARTGATLRTMRGARGMIFEVAASPDARWGIAVESASTLSLWDLASGSRVHAYATPWRPRPTTSCGDISPDGTHAAAGDWDDIVYVWDLRPAQGAWTKAEGGR